MKKLSTLLLISLLNIPSFAYATENSSIKEKDEKIETKTSATSATKDTSNMYIKIGINRPKITYNFGDLIKSDTFRTFSFNASLELELMINSVQKSLLNGLKTLLIQIKLEQQLKKHYPILYC